MNKNAKISLKTNDNTIKYDILLTIKNNKINYLEKNSDTNVFLSLDEKILIRDNKDIYKASPIFIKIRATFLYNRKVIL